MAIIRRAPPTAGIRTNSANAPVLPGDLIDLARKKGLTTEPIDIIGLVEILGLQLRFMPLEGEISGHLGESDGKWTITANSLHHPKRQRFTIAHEVAHYVLHRHLKHRFVDFLLFRNGQTDQLEIEANDFAASLLMPEDQFRQFVKDHSNKIELIADHFNVSALATRIRAKTLGFSGHGL